MNCPTDLRAAAGFSLAIAMVMTLGVGGPVVAQGTGADARTVTIEMTDFAFHPARVTVRTGDTVRFVQATNTPHNVEFRQVPDGAQLGDEYVVPVEEIGTSPATYPPHRNGPYLLHEGETYEFVVTDAFTAGSYDYVCTPHEAMGMTATLVVRASPFETPSSEH